MILTELTKDKEKGMLILVNHIMSRKCLNLSKKEIEEEDKDEKVKGTLLTT